MTDVLEEAAISKAKVTVVLADGTTVTDEVRDVVTENGKDWIVFLNHERIAVQDLKSIQKAKDTVH